LGGFGGKNVSIYPYFNFYVTYMVVSTNVVRLKQIKNEWKVRQHAIIFNFKQGEIPRVLVPEGFWEQVEQISTMDT
jgi:hypothetical protein